MINISGYLALGNKSFRDGKYLDALKFYKSAITENPSLLSILKFNINCVESKLGICSSEQKSEFSFFGSEPNDHLIVPTNENANPDFFNLRAEKSLSDNLVFAWIETSEDLKIINDATIKFDFPHEIVLCFSRTLNFDKNTVLKNKFCKGLTIGVFPNKKNKFSSFIYSLTEGILTKRKILIFLDAKELSDDFLSIESTICQMNSGYAYGIVSTSTKEMDKKSAEASIVSVWLSRIFKKITDENFTIPHGSFICNTILLKQLNALNFYSSAFDSISDLDVSKNIVSLNMVLGFFSHEGLYEVKTLSTIISDKIENKTVKDRSVKTIAFYLPQFHIVPENDKWWGKGFTEWNNVIRGKPMFRNHYQPRLPADLGYYDLRSTHTQVQQAKLAEEYGVHGFCYYYYWFDGIKVLNEPIEQMLNSGAPNFPFCVCWANENWSRNWDGQNKHVLLEQNYSLESNKSLIHEFIKMMRDERYIRHNGKPVLIVYRIKLIPDWKSTAEMWREECRLAGIGEIHLCSIRFSLEPLEGEPSAHGLDSYVLFPPQDMVHNSIKNDVVDLNRDFDGTIYSYADVVSNDIERFRNGYDWPVHRGAMLGWDNTARRMTASRIFAGCTPMLYRKWIKNILMQEEQHNSCSESLLFVNAWNEWAEGTTLEPDQRYGTSYLEVTKSVLSEYRLEVTNKDTKPKELIEIKNFEPSLTSVHSKVTVEFYYGAVKFDNSKKTVLFSAHISGHQLFGGERSFIDVLSQLFRLDVNIVVTLPSSNNKPYIEEIKRYCSYIYCLPYKQWVSNRNADPLMTLEFCNIIALHNVNVVYSNTIVLIEPALAAKLMNKISLVHIREFISIDDSLRERIGLPVQDIIRTVFDRYQFAIANSRATEKVFSRIDKTFYVPNAVDAKSLSMNNKFGKVLKFGIVSSNIPKKGVADFIELAKRCKDLTGIAEFIVIGPENEQIKKWKIELESGDFQANLKFLGYKESPRQAMSEINVLLSLSSFAESFGRTVAEALVASRPVIAYEWGAVPELIQHGETGYLAPFGDISKVEEYVRLICRNTKNVLEMGAQGHSFIKEEFSHEVLHKNLKAAFEKIIPDTRTVRGDGVIARKVTIVVPVFNAAAEVERCLESIIKYTDLSRDELIIINDGSSDKLIIPLLERYSQLNNVRVVNNINNIGYTKTVNLGIQLADDSDVILLNSDTTVVPSWLSAMRSSAYKAPDIGTVTAMSDNAGAFSFPISGVKNAIPLNTSHEQHAYDILSRTIHCRSVDVPTGSGFCFFIKRTLVDTIGLFDEVLFPRGYGEENDFCLRAIDAGWRNVVTPWAYIYHVRTASFKGEKEKLVKEGVDIVIKKFPDYSQRVKEAFNSKDMSELRNAVRSKFNE